VDVQLELEGVAIHTRLVTIVVEVDVANDLFADVALRSSRLIASSNCHEVRKIVLGDVVNAIADLLYGTSIKLIRVDGVVHIVVVYGLFER